MEMVHPVLTAFASKLKAMRLKKGVSQERLAEMAGLHRTYVSLVERGTCNISLLNIHKLAEALGVPLTKLMP
jgi:transcriptional regulator with XRE-family HTH domain